MSQDLNAASCHRDDGFIFLSVGSVASGGGGAAGKALLSPSLGASEPGKAMVRVVRGHAGSWLTRS